MTAAAGPIRILVLDDHPLLLEGIATLVGGQTDMTLDILSKLGANPFR